MKAKKTQKTKGIRSDLEAWNEQYRKTQKRIAARVKADPRAAMREAYEALDYGVEMLPKLIETKAFFCKMAAADGYEDHSHDDPLPFGRYIFQKW